MRCCRALNAYLLKPAMYSLHPASFLLPSCFLFPFSLCPASFLSPFFSLSSLSLLFLISLSCFLFQPPSTCPPHYVFSLFPMCQPHSVLPLSPMCQPHSQILSIPSLPRGKPFLFYFKFFNKF